MLRTFPERRGWRAHNAVSARSRASHPSAGRPPGASSPRHEVEQRTIDYLLPFIPGGGEIDLMPGWHLAFIEQHPGSLFFQLAQEPGLSRKPAVMCMVGWGDGDQRAWEDFTIGYEKLLDNPMMTGAKKAPRRAPKRPWLAAYLTPFAATVDGETLMAFGDLERCLA